MTQIEKAKNTLKKLLAKNTEIAAVNTELNEQVKNYSETLQTKETEIISLKDQIKTLEEQVSSSEARLTEEKDRGAKAEAEYKEKFDKYQLLDSQINELELLLEEKDQKIKNTESNTTQLANSLDTKDSIIADLKQQINSLQASTVSLEVHTKLEEEYEHLCTEKNNYCDDIIKYKNNLKESNDQNAILIKENSSLITKISEMEEKHAKELNTLKSRIKDLESVPSHTLEIEQLMSDKTELQRINAELEAQITILRGQTINTIKPDDNSEKKYFRFGHVSDNVMRDVNTFISFLYEDIDDDWKGPYELKPIQNAAIKAGITEKAAEIFIQRLMDMTFGKTKIIYKNKDQYVSNFSKSVIYKYINEIVM